MVAWWLWIMQALSLHEFVARLPAVAVPLLIARAMYRFIEPYGVDRARLITLLFLFTPIYLLLPITTTDTPFVLLAFVSMLSLTRAWRESSHVWFATAGVALGLAFLSKYFAALLGVAYLVVFTVTAEGRSRWRGFLVLILAASPAVAVNVVWNYYHCWDNILFNLFNRNQEIEFALQKPLVYLLLNVYLLTPVLSYYLVRRWTVLQQRLGESEFVVVGFSALVPLVLLLLVAIRRDVGLHWVMAFYPPLFMVAGVALTGRQLHNAARFMVGFAGLHFLVIAVLLTLPVSTWRDTRAYDEIVFLTRTAEVAQALTELGEGKEIFTTSYTPSAMLAHQMKRPVGVFGVGSRYARQDDMLTDFRALDGRDFLIVVKATAENAQFESYFERIERRSIRVAQASYSVVLGYGFRWQPYKEQILKTIRQRYYDIPEFLPLGLCGFLERYFEESN